MLNSSDSISAYEKLKERGGGFSLSKQFIKYGIEHIGNQENKSASES